MRVDVTAELTIARPAEEVGAYVRDPANDPVWIGGIREAEPLTEGPIGVGSRGRRLATFLGKRIRYVNEIVELRSNRLVMRSVESPIPMTVTYGFEGAGESRTDASIHVEGRPGGFYALAGPALNALVRRSISRDLATLRRILEGRTSGSAT
jgi:uncharacterized membrane protein